MLTNKYPARTIVETDGYIRERLPSGILVLRILDTRRESIDSWYQECNLFMSHWQPGQRLRYLHDIRHAEKITPHATDHVMRVLNRMKQIPVMNARGAVLVSNTVFADLLSPFLKRRTSWNIRFFTEETEALDWLAE